MGNIGDTISDSAPAVGTSGPGYATTINSLLTEFKARLTARIPLSALLTNSNLDLNGQALLNAAYITLQNSSTSPGASPVNRVVAYQGDFWWVGPSGALQLTNGPSLNAAGVGGITGDYSGAGPMEFRYDLANTRYDAFANQSTNTWAYVRARGFDIAGGATSNFRLRHLYSGTVNDSITWASGPGDDGTILTSDGAGGVEFRENVPFNSRVAHPTHYKSISAIDMHTRGFFSGAGTGALTIDGNGVPVHRLDTGGVGGGTITISVDIPSLGATTQDIPLLITGIIWTGLINGGSYPTIDIAKVQSQGSPLDTDERELASGSALTGSNTSGTIQKRVLSCNTPFEVFGDEQLIVTITASTNNLDTYAMTLTYTKEV